MKRNYRRRTEETWAEALAAYQAGETAEAVCERFNLGRTRFWEKARAAGLRRADLDDPEPLPEDETGDDAGDDLPDMDDQALADLAFRRMTVEARRGRLSAALSWGRLRDMALRQSTVAVREADRIDAAALRRRRHESFEQIDQNIRVARHIEAQARAVLAVARTDLSEEADEVDTVDSARPLSRADRRRRAALARKRAPP